MPQFPFRFSLAKRFKVVDGQVEWQRGSIAGMDPVLSFVVSY
jgi:outer membrane protein insertion porin family